MAVTDSETAFIDATSPSVAETFSLSQMFSVTSGSNNPTYLVLTVLDRNEYTFGASGATGFLTGDGQTLGLTTTVGSDGRGTGIVFTLQSNGTYTNSIYGNLNQLTYTASTSAGDVTTLSLFGTNSSSIASAAANADSMMEIDASGYLGSATVVTVPGYAGTVPSQATPDSIAAAAKTFIGQAWNENGCWTLASTIAAEAGTSLPVQTTLVGLAGKPNGEWIVAFDGPAGQSGNWLNMVTAGEMIVFEPSGGGGHITTCVSGSGSSAMLVDNIVYESGGVIQNPANDGSSADVLVSPAHSESQEFSGVSASTVVIYELDTPIVTTTASSESLDFLASLSLGPLFSATDPASKTITSWQIYDTATSDALVLGGVDYEDHTAAGALSATTLSGISLLAGSTATTDTVQVRAFNGSYWGDWEPLSVAIISTSPPPAQPPVLATQTASQTWIGGTPVSLVFPSNTFEDPQSEALSYAAALSNGNPLPSWLTFNASTDSFSGTAPLTAQTLSITVTATDTSELSVSDVFSVTVIGAPVLTGQTANQTLAEGKVFSLPLPANTFTDPQGETLTYKATQENGLALPSWLKFNAGTDTFSGTAPATAQSLTINVTATDSSSLSVSDIFMVTVGVAGPVVSTPTPNQTWKEGQAISLVLPTSTFTDPSGEKLVYAATQANGQALPSWLKFNATTDAFSGTAPTAAQTIDVKVAATDTSGLSVSDTFLANVLGAPVVTAQTANQTWTESAAFSLALPSNTFTDPQGENLVYTATQQNGLPLPNWLQFNGATDTFSGTAPATAQTVNIKVTATDTSGLAVSENFSATVQAAQNGTTPGITVTNPTPNQTWADGTSVALTLPANTFTDALGLKMTFAAYQVSGPSVTSWLYFNSSADELLGTVPASMSGTVELEVVATDSQHMTADDLFYVNFAPAGSSHTRADIVSIGTAQQVDPTQVAGFLAVHF